MRLSSFARVAAPAAVALTVAAASVAAVTQASAAQIGTLTFSSGVNDLIWNSQADTFFAATSGPCQAGGTNFQIAISGPGVPAAPNNLIQGNTAGSTVGGTTTQAFSAPVAQTLQLFAANKGIAGGYLAAGTYTMTLTCRAALSSASLGDYVGQFTITGSGASSVVTAVTPSPTPTSASPTPTSASPTPTSASPTPTSASPTPTSASPTPTTASPTPTTASPTPTTASPSPSPTPSPTLPAEVPTADGPLSLAGDLVPGGDISVSGAGFAVSSQVVIGVYSDPVVLDTVEADSAGFVAALVTLPADLVGPHTVVAVGVDSEGNQFVLAQEVDITAGDGDGDGSGGGDGGGSPGGAGGDSGGVPTGGLPQTGGGGPLALLIAGLAVLAGGVLVLLAREPVLPGRHSAAYLGGAAGRRCSTTS
jgi:hypothetical protein